jgi:hypothetical protein
LISQLARGALDEARADLRQLAADRGVHLVVEDGAGAGLVRPQLDLGAALGEAGDAALALAADLVAVGRVEVGERHLAAEVRADRAHPGLDLGGHLGVREFLDLLAAGDALLEDIGIVERAPHRLARGGDLIFAGQVHGGSPPSSSGVVRICLDPSRQRAGSQAVRHPVWSKQNRAVRFAASCE